MKRFFIVVIMFLSLALGSSSAKADDLSVSDTLKKLPSLKPGIVYDNKSYKLEYITTAEILNYKGVSLDAGWAADSDMAIVDLSYDLINLKKLGVNVPIIDLIDIRPLVFMGYKNIQFSGELEARNKFSWGEGVTLINVKY